MEIILKESQFLCLVSTKEALIQSDKKLFLFNIENYNKELFYQICLFGLGNFDYLEFEKPLELEYLFENYYNSIEKKQKDEIIIKNIEIIEKNNKIKTQVKRLCENSSILNEFFSIKIDTDRQVLIAIPFLVQGYFPNWDTILSLVNKISNVFFEDQKEFTQNVSKALSECYALSNNNNKENFENYIYPLYKNFLIPNKRYAILVTDLYNLCKNFQRC